MRDRIRYYTVKNGNAFWAPGRQADAYSFPRSQPLGPAGEAAQVAAIGWNAKWDKRKEKTKRAMLWPKGSLGHFYEKFMATTAVRLSDPRTREDYERTWPAISERFGKKLVTQISPADSEAFHAAIHPAHNPKSAFSWNDAHRTLKVWRTLLNATVSYQFRAQAPIGRVANPAPRGRSQIWTHSEIQQLSWAACVLGMPGMAAGIRLAWAGLLSPVDVWTLPNEGWRSGLVDHVRQKTGKRILVRVDAETAALVNDYIATRVALPASPLVRRANGKGYISKDTFGDDFRAVRALAFPDDERQFLDIRRSAATEARRGGATRDDLGKAMANRVDVSDALASTYLIDASDRVNEARVKARSGHG